MKTANRLKKIINLFYWTLVVWLCAAIAAFVYYTFIRGYISAEDPAAGTLNHPMWQDIVWTLILIFQFALFLWGIFHLRKSAHQLVTGNYFSNAVSIHFRKAGNIFIALGLGALVIHLVNLLYFSSIVMIGLDSQMALYIFILIIGLFFKLFSIAFAEAKALKEENSLTV